MKARRTFARILLVSVLMSVLLAGCKKNKVEDSIDMGQAIAKFLEIDKVELNSAKVVGRYNFVCFYYEGETGNGYSYAAFRKKATGDYTLEYAQLPSKLIPMADGIKGAYYDDYLILVSSNEKLDKIELSGEMNEDIKVTKSPFIYAVNIFQGKDTAKQVNCTFYDKNDKQIK